MKSKTASTPLKKTAPLREPNSTGTGKAVPSPVPAAPVSVPAPGKAKTAVKRAPKKPLLETMVNAAKKMLKPKAKAAPAKSTVSEQVIVSEKLSKTASTQEPVKAAKAAAPAKAVEPVKPAKVPVPAKPVVAAPVAPPVIKEVPHPVKRPAARRQKVEAPPILTEAETPAVPALAGPGEKYSLGHIPTAPGVEAPEVELPEAYGTKKLFLTARDPHWLYAHWDLTTIQQYGFNAESSDGHLVLRIYDADFKGHPAYEIHVHPESRHWFVHVERAGNSYCAELGFYSPLGKWIRISTSCGTVTPPDAISPETDVEFATIPFELPFAKLMRIIEDAVRDNLPLAQAIEELRRAGHPDLPRLKTSASGLAPVLTQAHLDISGQPVSPAAPSPGWTPQQEQALAKVISIDQSRRIWMGSLEITELIRRRLAQDTSSPVQAYGASVIASVSSLDNVSSPAVPFGVSSPADKNFWFNVNAELIIYGATEPGAKVTLGGHEIKLRPDGTFSYRFALPDGKYDLPAVAISADGTDGRAADLKFSRETEYLGEVGAHPQDSSLKAPLPDNLPENL
jgi:hypothetical protein